MAQILATFSLQDFEVYWQKKREYISSLTSNGGLHYEL